MAPMNNIPGNTAIESDAPASIPGTLTRFVATAVVEPLVFDSTNPPEAFGVPYKLASDGEAEAIEANDRAADVDGFIVRNVPSMAPTIAADAAEGGVPNKAMLQGGAPLGVGAAYMMVVCAAGDPVRGEPVFMRRVADDPLEVGGIEADSDVTATAGAMSGTGNATCGAVTCTKDAENGAHVALFTAATKFNLQTPSGLVLKQGTTGVAYSAGGLSFTITAGGTPAVAGDTITITVTKNNEELPGVTWASAGKDGNNRAEIRIS